MSAPAERPVRILRAEYPASARVLIAEDHRPTREALRTLLEQKGYEVSSVSDGGDAIKVLGRPDGPSIGIIDWMMPGASGLDVCRAIRSVTPVRYVYLIMVTARDREEDVAQALAVGADDFIRKPCGPSELIARVRTGQRTIELECNLARRVAELEDLVERIRQLEQETGTDSSHGICPDRMRDVRSGKLEPGARRPALD